MDRKKLILAVVIVVMLFFFINTVSAVWTKSVSAGFTCGGGTSIANVYSVKPVCISSPYYYCSGSFPASGYVQATIGGKYAPVIDYKGNCYGSWYPSGGSCCLGGITSIESIKDIVTSISGDCSCTHGGSVSYYQLCELGANAGCDYPYYDVTGTIPHCYGTEYSRDTQYCSPEGGAVTNCQGQLLCEGDSRCCGLTSRCHSGDIHKAGRAPAPQSISYGSVTTQCTFEVGEPGRIISYGSWVSCGQLTKTCEGGGSGLTPNVCLYSDVCENQGIKNRTNTYNNGCTDGRNYCNTAKEVEYSSVGCNRNTDTRTCLNTAWTNWTWSELKDLCLCNAPGIANETRERTNFTCASEYCQANYPVTEVKLCDVNPKDNSPLNSVCADRGEDNWQWVEKGYSIGSVFMAINPAANGRNFTVLSNGTNWIACKRDDNDISRAYINTSRILKVNENSTIKYSKDMPHEFICTYNPEFNTDQFVECSETCDSSINGGDSKVRACVEAGGNVGDYFCIRNLDGYMIWGKDLDDDPTGISCINGGYKWTGTRCCGDVLKKKTKDKTPPGDSYNDPNWARNILSYFSESDAGGCIAGTKVSTNTLASDSNILNDKWEGKYTGTDIDIGQGVPVLNGKTAKQNISYKIYPKKMYNISATFSGDEKIRLMMGGNRYAELNKLNPTMTFALDNIAQISNLAVELQAGSDPITMFRDINVRLQTNRIMNFNGTFYGCNLTDRDPFYDDAETAYTTADLITQSKQCEVKGNFFCLASYGWSNESANATGESEPIMPYERNYSTTTPAGEEGCCRQGYCWNGNACVPPDTEINDPSYRIENGGKTYVCTAGRWQEAVIKYDLWGREGFCSNNSNCLLDKYGGRVFNESSDLREEDRMLIQLIPFGVSDNIKSDNPMCVSSETKVGDSLCKGGNWTTRTKELAIIMIKTAGTNDFTLFCDNWDNVLPYSEKISSDQDLIVNYISGEKNSNVILDIVDEGNRLCGGDLEEHYPCANNYCILEYSDMILVGTTLNKNLSDEEHSFLKGVLKKPVDYCDSVPEYMQSFGVCSDDRTVFYNPKLGGIIYSTKVASIPPSSADTGIMGSLIDSIKNIITNLMQGKFSNMTKPQSYIEQNFAGKISRLNKIYVNKKGPYSIMAASERVGEGGKPTLTIAYPNVTAGDICESVSRIAITEGKQDIYCLKEGNTFQLTSIESAAINKYWQDLTSSLRVKK